MNCKECLSALATASLRDLSADSLVLAHCATCPDCSLVTTQLRQREHDAANLLNALPPMSNPLVVAETAVGVAKRRKLGRVAVMATGTALAATIFLAAQFTVIPAMNRADAENARFRTETIPLACLSPQQAADIISPYIRSNGSVYYLPNSDIAAITVRGTSKEVAQARDLIEEFQFDKSAACHTPRGAAGRSQQDIDRVSGEGEPVLAGEKATVPLKAPVRVRKR